MTNWGGGKRWVRMHCSGSYCADSATGFGEPDTGAFNQP